MRRREIMPDWLAWAVVYAVVGLLAWWYANP